MIIKVVMLCIVVPVSGQSFRHDVYPYSVEK
jgi:hypothetical protein